ncbi:androgen-induced gene 1 protein isoform X4 [Neopelma chrysocephalum]|uniref:androgen-induced gene 1 protein isoform X4 n=1 Tax=Neopelma chrysocephalum TaxID=114329 RepID=UPI000FCCEAFE|nr:androgen-induced gene 1 protein isoform X4 [Neopelma chrysocephalum]
MALVPCQVLRAAILLSYCSILCNYKAIDMPAHQTYGGSWKFLTFIDLGSIPHFFRLRGKCSDCGDELYGVTQEGVAAAQSPAGGTYPRLFRLSSLGFVS